jgi:hypothetical protein
VPDPLLDYAAICPQIPDDGQAQEPSYRVIEELEAIEAAGASLWGTEKGVAEAILSLLVLLLVVAPLSFQVFRGMLKG